MTAKKTILIVDDDERNAFAMSKVMRSGGFKVYSNANLKRWPFNSVRSSQIFSIEF